MGVSPSIGNEGYGKPYSTTSREPEVYGTSERFCEGSLSMLSRLLRVMSRALLEYQTRLECIFCFMFWQWHQSVQDEQ